MWLKEMWFDWIFQEHDSHQDVTLSEDHRSAISNVLCWNRISMCRYIGDGHPTFNRNPYNGYLNPYYWVDDHPLLYGNNGSLDPSTCALNTNTADQRRQPLCHVRFCRAKRVRFIQCQTRSKVRVKSQTYCWWLKSCTTWDVWNPINNGINYL